ncbi:hypothetical protein BDR04DRAFT_1163835 [Suillus decipiens]|nr:hypothetical protein BDR04DRAFT_1163835 [Suillus decipiens]
MAPSLSLPTVSATPFDSMPIANRYRKRRFAFFSSLTMRHGQLTNKQRSKRIYTHSGVMVWEVEDICEVLGVSQASLCFRWRNMFEELGTVARSPSPLANRARIIT